MYPQCCHKVWCETNRIKGLSYAEEYPAVLTSVLNVTEKRIRDKIMRVYTTVIYNVPW